MYAITYLLPYTYVHIMQGPSCSYSKSTAPSSRRVESNESSIKGFCFTHIMQSNLICIYAIVLYLAATSGQMRKVTDAKTRIHIWRCDKKKKEKIIGVYQPEIDGFEVLSIHQGTQVIHIKYTMQCICMHIYSYRSHTTSYISE